MNPKQKWNMPISIILSICLFSIFRVVLAEDLKNGFTIYLPLIQNNSSNGTINLPPNSPSVPLPIDGESHVSIFTNLSWSAIDPDGDILTYDVYLEAEDMTPNVLVSSNQSTTFFTPGTLIINKIYYWQVIAKDDSGLGTPGPVWSFDTIPNSAPNQPSDPSPVDGANGISTTIILSWICDDPEHELLTYDIYFEDNDSTPDTLVSNDQLSTFFDPGPLSLTTDYYWQVVATDEYGLSTPGPVWFFTTNQVPNTPINPTPNDGEIGLSPDTILSWTASDPDGDTLTYDVYLESGDTSPDILVSSNQISSSFDPEPLSDSATYYWQIVAKDDGGLTTNSPVWSFTTNRPPTSPSIPSPLNEAISVSTNSDLSWTASDPDEDTLKFDVYLEAGDTSPDIIVSSNQSSTSFDPGTLNDSTIYYWKIVVIDDGGLTTTGPVWKFRTNFPPSQASSPYPQDDAIGISIYPSLSWYGNDLDGDILTFDIFFEVDDSTPDVLISSSQQSTSYSLGSLLSETKYYWQIITTDIHNVSTPSPIWEFTTKPSNIIPQSISAGGFHTCALTLAGGVKCWGRNVEGRLGDGTYIGRYIPADVVGLTSGVIGISAGDAHTCVLTTNGGIKCWGFNGGGHLGDGTYIDKTTPVDVIGLTSGVYSMTTGSNHSCAITNQGGVKCWGNFYGDSDDETIPTDIVGLESGVVDISAGMNHTCVLTDIGGVKCWGQNAEGQLGDGTYIGRDTPADVVGLTSGVIGISAGGRHTCALTNEGGMKCWGLNASGQIGDGTTIMRNTPVDVIGLNSGVIDISAGNQHTCALTNEGKVKCWGLNFAGQLGDGSYIDRYTPVDVIGLIGENKWISAGYEFTCAINGLSEALCWGKNEFGNLGDGTTANYRNLPVEVFGLSDP